MFTVATPAATTALTTLEAVKLRLDKKDTEDDKWFEAQIGTATEAAIDYLGVEMAEDGTRHIGRETVVETLDRRSRYPWVPPFGIVVPRREADSYINLARRPVVSIASITENGTTLDPCEYELFATTGHVKRLSSALPAAWPCTIIVVTYTAGWLLPDDRGRNLPAPIESAVIDVVVDFYFARKRDPALKMEYVLGVWQGSYWGDTPLPRGAMAKLNPYRNISL
jgi:hypothetical protein